MAHFGVRDLCTVLGRYCGYPSSHRNSTILSNNPGQINIVGSLDRPRLDYPFLPGRRVDLHGLERLTDRAGDPSRHMNRRAFKLLTQTAWLLNKLARSHVTWNSPRGCLYGKMSFSGFQHGENHSRAGGGQAQYLQSCLLGLKG